MPAKPTDLMIDTSVAGVSRCRRPMNNALNHEAATCVALQGDLTTTLPAPINAPKYPLGRFTTVVEARFMLQGTSQTKVNQTTTTPIPTF